MQLEGSAGVDGDKATYDLRLKSLKDLKVSMMIDFKGIYFHHCKKNEVCVFRTFTTYAGKQRRG